MRKGSVIVFILFLITAALFTFRADTFSSECGGVFKKKCTKCHPEPSPLGYSKPLWNEYVERMAGKAKLSKTEKECIMGLNSTIIPR